MIDEEESQLNSKSSLSGDIELDQSLMRGSENKIDINNLDSSEESKQAMKINFFKEKRQCASVVMPCDLLAE